MQQFLNHLTAIILGLLSGFLFLYSIEELGHFFYPLPQKLNLDINNDIHIIREYVSTAPVAAMLFPIISYVLGAFSGGFVSDFISKRVYTSIIVGGIIFLLNLLNLSLIPHPFWFVVASSILPFPFALLGGKVAKHYSISKSL